jgi:hypothetical protein
MDRLENSQLIRRPPGGWRRFGFQVIFVGFSWN